jgi:hypothetical protein
MLRSEIYETSFDHMAPFRVGLFSDGQLPRPVLRVVFALRSGKAGISFSTTLGQHDDHAADSFAAFDIWCAGLSPDTFKYIGDDDLAPYRLLLERSLRAHDALELEKTDDRYMDDLTRAEIGRSRRATTSLAMPDYWA